MLRCVVLISLLSVATLNAAAFAAEPPQARLEQPPVAETVAAPVTPPAANAKPAQRCKVLRQWGSGEYSASHQVCEDVAPVPARDAAASTLTLLLPQAGADPSTGTGQGLTPAPPGRARR